MLGFFLGILASHFAPSTRCFYTLFPPLKLPTTRDVHSTPQQSFSPFRRECFYERSSSLSLSFQRERERERKRSHHSFSHIIDLFCDLNAKALREFRESFSTHTGCFCPKKKRRSSLNNARKFSRVLKHSLRAFREQKRKRKSVPRERERFSLCWRRPLAFGRRVLLIRKLFERETTE